MTKALNMEQELLHKIRKRDQRTLARVYAQTYPMVLRHIADNSGSKEDAQDILQDAFYLLMRKADEPAFVLTSEVSTFLMGISKNLWLKKITKAKIDPGLYRYEVLASEENAEEPDEVILNRTKQMAESISSLGEPCKTLLVQYYYFKQTMKEIAAMLHYTNAENAKNQKYKCLQRLKRMVNGTND